MTNLQEDIDALELSVRSYHCLQDMGIQTLGQLTGVTEKQLLRTRNLGKKSLKEIKEHLARFDLHLKEQGGK